MLVSTVCVLIGGGDLESYRKTSLSETISISNSWFENLAFLGGLFDTISMR